MAFEAGQVVVALRGDFSPGAFKQFDGAVKQSGARAQEFDKHAKRAGSSMNVLGYAARRVAFGGVAAMGGAFVGVIKKAADFQGQLSSLQSVTSANGQQMAKFRQQALQAGAATKFSALQAAQAQTELAKGGLSVAQIMSGGLKAALGLAAAGEMDLADAAATTANAMNLFKIRGSDATHVADALATAANATTADVSDFALALQQGGSAAHAAGLSFDQTIVALEALAKSGIKGSDAGTSLKTALIQLASPTAKQAQATKQLGLNFFDAHGKIKSLGDISGMLGDKLGTLTRKQRLNAEATIAGTDGFRTLEALYEAGPKALDGYTRGVAKQGTAAEVAAKKQDNLKGKIENLKGSVETAAIVLGSKLLPQLEKGATKATEFINSLVQHGNMDQWANAIIAGGAQVLKFFGELVQVGRDIGPALAGAAGVVVHLVGALAKIADLGNAGHLEALLAGIVGFKAAGAVAPLLMRVAAGISAVAAAGAEGGIASALSAVVGMVNPVTAVAVGIGALAAAFVLLGSRESAETALANASAAAKREQAAATQALAGAENDAAHKHLDVKQAELDHASALERLNKLTREGKTNTDAYKQAQLDAQQTGLRLTDARVSETKATKKLTDEQIRTRKAAAGVLKGAQDEVAHYQKNLSTLEKLHASESRTAADKKKLAAAQDRLKAATQNFETVNSRATASQVNYQRELAGAPALLNRNIRGVLTLTGAMRNVPKSVRTKLLADNQNALAQAGTLAQKLEAMGKHTTVTKILTNAPTAQVAVAALHAAIAGVPRSKVVHIEQNGASSASQIRSLQAAIDALHGKSVTNTVTTVFRESRQQIAHSQRAAGRGPMGAETALTGEGGGPEWRVDPRTMQAERIDRPTIMNLGPSDYVIPTESKFRGRALGLLAMLAKDLGVQGYAAGRAAGHKKKHPKHYHPRHLDPLHFSPDELQSRRDDAKKVLDADRAQAKHIGQTEASIRDIERRKAKSKAQRANKADDLKRAKKKLREERAAQAAIPRRAADYRQRRRELSEANRYQAEIEKQSSLADIAADAMTHADNVDNVAGYNAAKGDRLGYLKQRRKLLQDALKHAPANSAWARTLQKALGEAVNDIDDTSAATISLPDATAYTDAEQGKLDALGAAVALAALTGPTKDDPTGVKDDAAALAGILGIETGALARLQRGHAAPGLIQQVAENIASTRGDIANLAGPTDTGTTAATGATPEQIATAAATQVASFLGLRGDALKNFGGNQGGVSITNHFTEPPPDPHLWTRGVAFEATQAFS